MWGKWRIRLQRRTSLYSGVDLSKAGVRQQSPKLPLRKTTERGRRKELNEAELREGIASALMKGVYGRSD